MPDIFNVNSENFVGGPGRLVVAELSVAAPARISDVMDTTNPYSLKDGWRDLGATSEGISISRGFETEDFEVDQIMGAADTEVTAYSHSLSTSLAENTLVNRQLALVGGEIIETPAELGDTQLIAGALAIGARNVTLTTADVAFKVGGWMEFTGGELKKIASVNGASVVLEQGVEKAYATTDSVSPVTDLPTKRIGYGTKRDVPYHRYALISQKKDGTLYMAVFRKAKVGGDDKEQAFNKSKRLLPLSLTAFPEDGISDSENVYYEIEESI